MRILFPIVTTVFILFIFSNSLQNGTDSGSRSGFAVQLLEGFLRFWGISAEIPEFFVRKGAHFTEYFILGLLLLSTLRTYSNAWIRQIFIPLFWGLAVPVCDEFLQLFVPGRSGQVSDVVLDFSGVVSGMAVLAVFFLLWEKRKRKTVL